MKITIIKLSGTSRSINCFILFKSLCMQHYRIETDLSMFSNCVRIDIGTRTVDKRTIYEHPIEFIQRVHGFSFSAHERQQLKVKRTKENGNRVKVQTSAHPLEYPLLSMYDGTRGDFRTKFKRQSHSGC